MVSTSLSLLVWGSLEGGYSLVATQSITLPMSNIFNQYNINRAITMEWWSIGMRSGGATPFSMLPIEDTGGGPQ